MPKTMAKEPNEASGRPNATQSRYRIQPHHPWYRHRQPDTLLKMKIEMMKDVPNISPSLAIWVQRAQKIATVELPSSHSTLAACNRHVKD